MAHPRHVVAICFTNFGPYHSARLEALGRRLQESGSQLIAYELAGSESKYPWVRTADDPQRPYRHVRLFPDRSVESLSSVECRRAMRSRLDLDQPTAIAAVGYVRPESMEMLRWAKSNRALRILLSESQKIDHPRVWWKERIKSLRVRQFQAGVVGGPSHRSYLDELGLPENRVHLGYDAVGNSEILALAESARRTPSPLLSPYFLSVCRFAPEKNLGTLIKAHASYVRSVPQGTAWKLVMAGDGPLRDQLRVLAEQEGIADLCVWPGFLPIDRLVDWYVHAGAFVLPSRSEPWGLVANEAALCAVPLLISEKCGCAETFVPASGLPTGWTFDPDDQAALTELLTQTAALSPNARRILGESARSVARQWGPERFADGVLSALESASGSPREVLTKA